MSHSEQEMINIIKQLNSEPAINEEHRDRTRQQALEAYDKRADRGTPIRRTPFFQFKGASVMRIAASIAILTTIGFFANSILNPTPTLAFAEVARAILRIENASFEIDAGEDETHTCIMQVPGRVHCKMSDGTVFIADLAADKMLEIDPERKVAVLFDGLSVLEDTGKPEDFLIEIQNHLRRAEKSENFGDVHYTKLGEKRINGKLTVGYRVSDPGEKDFDTVDIWADPKTALPIQLDYTVVIGESKVVSTLKNFKYNQMLDPKLFSLEPPEGYKLLNENIGDPATLEDLANSFRVYAERTDGHFPPALGIEVLSQKMMERIDAIGEAWVKANPGKQLLEEDLNRIVDRELSGVIDRMLEAFDFIEALDAQGVDYTYAGRGVKLGDKDRPVFWYRPKDSDKFRIVYGDLRIQEANKAPAKP